jgi:hypothetical protein
MKTSPKAGCNNNRNGIKAKMNFPILLIIIILLKDFMDLDYVLPFQMKQVLPSHIQMMPATVHLHVFSQPHHHFQSN